MSYPDPASVREGVVFGEFEELVGSLQLPAPANVESGTNYGGGGTESTGTLVIPATGNVRQGINFGPDNGYVGELVLPSVSSVLYGTNFGTFNDPDYEFAGNVVLPEVANVQSGINYGSFDGSTYQYVGEFSGGGGGGYPNATDVRWGTVFGNSGEYTGSAYIPSPADVRDGTAVDASVGTLVLPELFNVLSGVSYGSDGTQFTGNAPDLASLMSTVNSILIRTPDYKPSVNTGGEIRVSVVNGDITGKVLGFGSGTISGVGVRAVDGSGNAIAPAATALSSANWTTARAGYLDKLNVTGTLAHTDNANTFKADVSALATASAVAALPSASTIATATAAAILASPSNKLATSGSGYVTTTNPGGGASASDIASAVRTNLSAELAMLDAPVSSVSAAGSGAYTYTVTVTSNGSTPVNGARVRLSGGAEPRLLTTGSNGVAAFSADAGTYTLSVTASGYTYTPTTVSLSGNATATITLTAVSIPAPADASQTTAYTTCRDGQGVAVSNAAIYFRFKARAGDADSYDRTNFTATSNGAGLLTVSLPRNAQMQGRRGLKGAWIDFTTGDGDTYELPQLLGGFGA